MSEQPSGRDLHEAYAENELRTAIGLLLRTGIVKHDEIDHQKMQAAIQAEAAREMQHSSAEYATGHSKMQAAITKLLTRPTIRSEKELDAWLTLEQMKRFDQDLAIVRMAKAVNPAANYSFTIVERVSDGGETVWEIEETPDYRDDKGEKVTTTLYELGLLQGSSQKRHFELLGGEYGSPERGELIQSEPVQKLSGEDVLYLAERLQGFHIEEEDGYRARVGGGIIEQL